MRRLLHKVLTLLLTAVVLIGSLVPPAVSHAHIGGDRPHSHDSKRDEYTGHDEHGGHKHSRGHAHIDRHHDDEHGSHDKCVESGLEHHSAHLHTSFVGLDFSIPLPHRDGSNGPMSPDDRQLGFVRLIDDVIPVSRVDVVNALDTPTAALDYSVQFAAEMSHIAKCSIRAVDRTLLCDSARCERSGVLLI